MLIITLLNTLSFIILNILGMLFYKQQRSIFTTLLVLGEIGAFILVYFSLPSRNFLDIIWMNFVSATFFMIIMLFVSEAVDEIEGHTVFNNNFLFKTMWCLIIILLLISMTGFVHSNYFVKSTYNSIKISNNKASQAPLFKKNETPIAIAPSTVLNRVHKSISDLPNSQYFNVSHQVQAQYYKGKPVYIVPIQYDGFWAMQKAHHQIPGYFMIDATHQNATPKFIHKPYSYAISAYFGHDVSRQLYRHNPEWLKLGDSKAQLEIDNNGNPYWIQTVYKSELLSHKINYQQLHVAIMNAKTGKTKTYNLNNLPKWIDEGITSDVAAQMNHDFGYYQHGYWNKFFGKTGLKKPTDNGPENGVTSVFDINGNIHYFTDFTNPNSSDSALGYSMINARTGKLDYYRTSGIMDSNGAKENANQNYRAQKWHSAMPIIYNVSGKPTWVMNILDDTKAIRGYYYLNASDQSIYAYGNTVNSTLESYLQAIVNNGGNAGNTINSKVKKIAGTIDRVAIVSNKNKVMFTLSNSNTVFTINTDDYDKANLLRSGDEVTFKARITNNQAVGNIKSFKNNSLK